jgi:hypothetical protein
VRALPAMLAGATAFAALAHDATAQSSPQSASIPLLRRGIEFPSGAGKPSFAYAGGSDITAPLSFNGFAQAFDALAAE